MSLKYLKYRYQLPMALFLVLFIFTFVGPISVQAYRQPVSSEYMSPYCPLNSDGSKNIDCLYIPKSECDYFVSKQGNDNNPGSEASPFSTIEKGVDSVTAGKNLCIKGYSDGTTYSEGVSINNMNGNNNAWITIGGYESDKRVVIQGSNYSGGTISITDSSYIRIMGIEVTKANNGFTAQESNNIDFINLKAYDNWNWGIGVPNNNGPSQRIRMEHSEIYDNVKKNVLDPDWNPNSDNEGQGGTGAQFNEVAEGAYRYNILYRNFGEGLDVHKDSNQVIIEDNIFSENSHTAFYVNHSSNILFHRNVTICSGEKPAWHEDNDRNADNLGTAITFRQEEKHNSPDTGGNNAAINNIVMGCTVHLVATTQITERPVQSLLVANNTFIDARKKEGNNEKAARFVQLQNDSAEYAESVVFLNNIFKFVDTRASLANSNAVELSQIIFSENLTDGDPGFSEGITQVGSLPFLGNYDHTTFLGNNPKPWEMSLSQVNNLRRWVMLASGSPAINTGSVTIPAEVPTSDKSRFEYLYQDYLNQDHFGNSRGNSPDIGAHEAGGVEPSPMDETVVCLSKEAQYANDGPLPDSLVSYTIRLDWPEGSTGIVKLKDYYSNNTRIETKPSYCIEGSEEILGVSDVRKGSTILTVSVTLAGTMALVATALSSGKFRGRKKLAIVTGIVFAGTGMILIVNMIENEIGPRDSEAQVVQYLECNVPEGLEEITYEVKIIGNEGSNVTNEVVVYEDDVEVSSCIKEFVVEEASDEGSTPTPTSTPIMGNTCGRADSDEDGDFDISDFVEFAAAYRDGNRSCDDTTADYGVCGGRDVDRDGKLDIADFGGTNGFASRYYPKTSCALY